MHWHQLKKVDFKPKIPTKLVETTLISTNKKRSVKNITSIRDNTNVQYISKEILILQVDFLRISEV